MANFCINKVIITHHEKSKVRGLYHVSSGDLFNFILPTPVELCNEDTLKDKLDNIEEFGADNLSDWRLKNWGNRYPPVFGCEERKLSKNGEILFLDFVTKWMPAIGIFEELERQGYRVKAYFWDHCGCNCGSYIYGVVEYINYAKDNHDIPLDVDMFFGIEEYVRIYEYRDVKPEPDITKTSMLLKPCYNKVIIKHDDLEKLKGMYHFPSGYFSDFIKLYPQKLINSQGLITNQDNSEEIGAQKITDWVNKNRSSRRPHPETIERTLSKDGSFLMLQFETSASPPIEIYDELEEQGFHVRAYFFAPYARYCGSFIHGTSEWYEIYNDQSEKQDIPQDLDKMFGVGDFWKLYDSEEGGEYPDESNDHDKQEDDRNIPSSMIIDDPMSYFCNI